MKEKLFEQFHKYLDDLGLFVNEGKIIDASWTQKGGGKFYRYKDHAKINVKSKLIDIYDIISTEVHDS